MFKKLLAFSLTHRPIILMALFVFVGAGIVSFLKLNVEAYPNPAPVILEITAQAPGLSAEEIEKKTNGTTIVKSKFKKMSPKGLKITAFSLKINPKIHPKEIAPRRIKDDA